MWILQWRLCVSVSGKLLVIRFTRTIRMALEEPEFRDKLSKLPYRKRYAGWFIASILWFVLIHHLLIDTLFLSIFGLSLYLPAFLVFVCAASGAGITYFGARAFTPPESVYNLVDNWRIKSVVAFGVAYLTLWVIANVANLSKESPYAGWFVLAVMGIFYGTALIVGWDAGRSKVTIEKYDSIGFGRESKVLDILENTSRERAFSFLVVTVLISIASGVTLGWGMAISTFAGIVTFVDVMLKFGGRID